MNISDHDLAAIFHWPLLHPGETAILPDGSAVLLQNIVMGHCTFDAPRAERLPVNDLAHWFQTTPRSLPVKISKSVLTHPVLVMITRTGSFIGLDGRARVDLAIKYNVPELPVIFIHEDDVRRLGQIDLEFLFEDEEEDVTAADKAMYRTVQLITSVYSHRVTSRPWRKVPDDQLESAFGAGSLDGKRLGRPYLQARPEPRGQKGQSPAGRKKIPDLEKLDIGIGRTLAAIRDRLHEIQKPRALEDIVCDLKLGKMRYTAHASALDNLIVSLPTERELQDLVTRRNQYAVIGAGKPANLSFEELDACYSDTRIVQLLLLLRDLGTMRLRVQDFDRERNALMREAQRGDTVDKAHYDRMLFDHSNRATFEPLPQHLSIPGLIDPMAVADETGVLACNYQADYLFTLPMFRAAAMRGEIVRGNDTIVDRPTAIAYLQHRAHDLAKHAGAAAHWWTLSVGNDELFPKFFDFAATAAVRKGEPVLFSAARVEIQRAMASHAQPHL